MEIDIQPPHDISAEESVIGSLLIDGEAMTRITSILKPPDFYSQKTLFCFQAAQDIFSRSEPIDQISLAHELQTLDRLDAVGGVGYLAHLVALVPTSVHIEHYAEIVRRTATMRQVIAAGQDIMALGYRPDSELDSVLSKAEALIWNIRSNRRSGDFVPLREYMDTYLELAGAMAGNYGGKALAPVMSGYTDLDNLLQGGFQRGDLFILAARPSLGKSTLALNMAVNAAATGQVVGVYSLEMSGEQLAMRLLSADANVSATRLRSNLLTESEELAVLDSVGELSKLPLYIDETPFQNALNLRGKARRLQAEHGLDLLVIDYLQLIDTGGRENRSVGLGEVSRSLKGMARDLDMPVIACSQLSRAIELRPNHRPILSDLRESGSIEQDADIVAFIHREDKFVTRSDWDKMHPDDPFPENIAELIIAKHRNGPTGTVGLYFKADTVKFETLTGTTTMSV